MKRKRIVAVLSAGAVIAALTAGACSQKSGSGSSSGSGSGPASVQGTWTGAAGDDGGDTLPIAFALTDDKGVLSGFTTLFDPVTGAAVKAGAVTGQRTGSSAHWTSTGGLAVTGEFSGKQFSGMAVFPGALTFPDRTTAVHLVLGVGQ